ncbi:MAG: ChaN family lipoprotein [Anaeromyxobacter sp.]
MRLRPRPLPLALTALALAAGCSRPAARPGAPAAEVSWASPRLRDHPLVGRIWDVQGRRFVEEAALDAALSRADLVLLGEAHDNRDHHQLQARALRALTAAGRRPALAFEMLDRDQQPAVDAALAARPPTPEGLRDAVAWDQSGWPPFAHYRPVFEAGLSAGLPIVAANLPRGLMRRVVHEGADALPAEVRARLDQAGPLAPEQAQALREEMAASHCGMLPERMMAPMVTAQRARDAQLAATLLQAGAGRGAALITGAEHARRDRGVPSYLPADAKVVSVAFREVWPELEDPAAEGHIPYDYVVFTPAAEREDPCEGLRKQLDAHEARGP